MSEVTYVAEIRFRDMTELEAKLIESVLAHVLKDVEAELLFGAVGLPTKWRAADLEDRPSEKQAYYFKKLINELNYEIRLTALPDTKAQHLLMVARTSIIDPDLTKRRMSELIDAVKEEIDDVKFIRTNIVTEPLPPRP